MAQTAFILILTDDEPAGRRLRDLLRRQHGHSCMVVSNLDDALNSIRSRAPDVVVSAHPGTAAALADLLDTLAPDATLLTIGPGPAPPAARRIRVESLNGAATLEHLVEPIASAAGKAVARREDRLLKQSFEQASLEAFEGIVGVSRPMKKIIERIKKAARNKLTVLILGETGTGKELIARAIHTHSDRARRPFQALNCAGLSETLIESELFGHVKGAFTGAVADRKGHFAAADGGTLFLDEIGDMPLPMQAKLLRVLEHREFSPVGSTEVHKVDVRLISATHTDLARRLEEKQFRDDLYYRLHQWVIEVPPLRERREDIPLLAHYLVQQANAEHGLSVEGVASEAMALLTRHYWPGNVRELKNVIESVACEVGRGLIEAEHLPERLRGSRELAPLSAGSLAGLTMAQIERLAIERTLQATGGNREQAAKMLNIGTRTLYRKIKEYGLAV